ncbi:MAG: transcription-repair-coupling factor [Candidatus Poribacteria bacterium]|nr:MAG: transcription-repair-coupling factor [Candidatus Poribacteria bacterium]
MEAILERFLSAPAFRRAVRRLEASRQGSSSLGGVSGSAHGFLLAALRRSWETRRPLLAVFPTQEEARKAFLDLRTLKVEGVAFYPLLPDYLGELSAEPVKGLRVERLEAWRQLQEGGVVLTAGAPLAQRVPDGRTLLGKALSLNVGDWIDFTQIPARLRQLGYRRVETVELKGEFTVRGGIVDLFPPTAPRPYRLEFFGDEIESIRTFDESTQRSLESVERVWIGPCRECVLDEAAIQRWTANASARIAETATPSQRRALDELTETLVETGTLPHLEQYYPLLFEGLQALGELLPPDTLVYWADPEWTRRELEAFLQRIGRLAEEDRKAGRVWVSPDEAFLSPERLWSALERHPRLIVTPQEREETLGCRPIVEERGSLQRFLDALPRWREEGHAVVLFSESAKAAVKMEQILEDHQVPAESVRVEVGWLSEGFQSELLRLVVIPQEAIFGRERRVPHRAVRFQEGRPLFGLFELKEGDYVVHTTHGIGRFLGVQRMTLGGQESDCLILEYAGGERLYVPTYHLDLVQRYIGEVEEKPPKLDRLGGASWARVKARVRRSVEELAEELLELYAARQMTPGRVFEVDHPWVREFEAAFPFEETPDQQRAIEEVYADLAKPRPMDRLICGDVGFGKTEVAMRAAFVAVLNGTQVAVLVPTTVLAQQHYFTFTERFRGFPVEIRQLSRLVRPAETRRTLELLSRGAVDIVIGTHRLLSKDVRFRNLGLLIIDEEHRFGVRQKERIRQLRKHVDTLTLSATPIPRTLHMSITSLRDLSLIATPPENRLPIETIVTEYRPETVREGILRELSRGGQVFFVHNRVQGIESIAQRIRELVPQARVAVGHGQMSERGLEETMLRFVRHEYDVLVCTTIIESGLDIPNVNTIMINRADMLGLAQLYQLRGRVGRSDRKAYGYLFYPPDRVMTEEAMKRLRVIEEFTDLGSGFRIALHDLEIRGAGNLLGPEQHGHIAAVGYELYCKLLEEAIAKKRGQPLLEEVETRIRLPVSAYLPSDYVSGDSEKIRLYRRIANLRTQEEREEIAQELLDRFGKLPEPAEVLLDTAYLKALGSRAGATLVSMASVNDREATIVFDEVRALVSPDRIVELIQSHPGARLMPPCRLVVPVESTAPREIVRELIAIFHALEGASPDG